MESWAHKSRFRPLSLGMVWNGNPLRCSFLENPRDRGAWWAAVYGVAQSRTRLEWLSISSSSSSYAAVNYTCHYLKFYIYMKICSLPANPSKISALWRIGTLPWVHHGPPVCLAHSTETPRRHFLLNEWTVSYGTASSGPLASSKLSKSGPLNRSVPVLYLTMQQDQLKFSIFQADVIPTMPTPSDLFPAISLYFTF